MALAQVSTLPFAVAATDLDDTLLSADGSVSTRSIAAIEAWIDSGRRMVIATGRPPRSIGPRLPSLLHAVPWICYNGAEIRLDGTVIYRRYIPENRVLALVDRLLGAFPEITIGIELDDLLWLNRARPVEKTPHAYQRVTDLRTVAHLPTAKVILFASDAVELMAAVQPLPDGVRLMPSGRYPFIQLMAEATDKVTALRYLVEGWGERMENVVAFGDDVNDVELLREAGMGVAVANAFPQALQAADRITASNEEDGVAIVLEELLRGMEGNGGLHSM